MTGRLLLGDLRAGWRALLAVSLGLASGLPLQPFVMSVLAPRLVMAMHWSKAEFAGVAAAAALTIPAYPIVGRLADRFGVRVVGGIGLAAMTAGYCGIAALDGSISHYIGILLVQVAFGAMTTGPVYLRLIVRDFDRSRGLALAIAVSFPAVVAAVASPLLARYIESDGWRAGAIAVAIWTLVAGIAALVLVPAKTGDDVPMDGPALKRAGFREVFANRTFRRLILITVLVSMPLVLSNAQLALVLVDNGLDAATASAMVGLFAVGTIGGRLGAGVALDRFAARLVGAITFSLPAFGMLLLASPFDQPVVLGLAILSIGVAFGAEGDVLAFIVSRWFPIGNYGTALGMLFAAAGSAAGVGAAMLGLSLNRAGTYGPFLVFGSLSVILGSILLLRLPERMSDAGGAAA